MIYCFTVYIVYLSMLEQATFLSLKLEFENMVMSMLIGNPAVFIRGCMLKKESKIALKKVDLSLFFPTKKVPVNHQKHAF